MAATQLGHSVVENAEDPVQEVTRWVVTTLLREEEQALVSEMVKYCNNLS